MVKKKLSCPCSPLGRRIGTVILICMLAYGIYRFCRHYTRGFTLLQIQNTYLEAATNPPLEKEIEALLRQPFRYLNKGKQCFAFLSEDKTVVLKLFNNHYQNRLFWLCLFPFFPEKVAYNQNKLARTYKSYQIAYETLKDETGLLYLHLNRGTELKHPVCLIDNLGITHVVDLNVRGFLLQKKAQLVYPMLRKLMEEGKIARAKEAVNRLIALIHLQYKNGVGELDPLLRTNFGFLEDAQTGCIEAVQIDVGSFMQNGSINRAKKAQIIAGLKDWLSKHYPELLPLEEP